MWHVAGAGGRMVKWLEEICVAPEESQNFYHFHDNRVLPPGVDQEKAKAEGAQLLSLSAIPLRRSLWDDLHGHVVLVGLLLCICHVLRSGCLSWGLQ
jgi:hypothetical protein